MKQANMKRAAASVFTMAVLAFALGFFHANASPPQTPPPPTERDMETITALTIQVFSRFHYDSKRLDDAASEEIFKEFLQRLDPVVLFFRQSDVDQLKKDAENLRFKLASGKSDFAFQAYEILRKRLAEYEEFAAAMLSKDVDLTKNEEFVFDRSKAVWPKNDKEQHDLWARKIKNDIILAKLGDMAMAAAEKEAKAKKESGEGETPHAGESTAVTDASTTLPRKTPEQRILWRIHQLRKYYDMLEPIEVLEIYLTTIASMFDPHSAYMSPPSAKRFDSGISLSLNGIGAILTNEDGYTKVVEIVVGGPAEKDGRLKPGDRIIAVQQENADPVDVVDMPLDKVVDQIRGPRHTKVTLTILEAEKGSRALPVQITLTRDKIQIKEAEARGSVHEITSLDGSTHKLGVIVLPSFYMDFDAAHRGEPDFKSSSNDVKKILQDFKKEEVSGVVLDLRSNGGGSLREAVLLTGLFIPSGPVVQVRDHSKTESQNDEDNGEIVYGGPLIVLVNRLSASASEIFAAAMKDYRRGVIVGDLQTHGKGTVQVVSELDRYLPFHFGKRSPAGTIKLTNAKFYRVNGESTQIKGVASDIVLPSFSDNLDLGESKLQHALPWDTVKPVEYTKFTGKASFDSSQVANLREKSGGRVAENKHFQRLLSDIGEYQKLKNRKTVSLNFEERKREYLQEKQIREEQEKIFELDKNERKQKDIYLEESLQILCDMISLMHRV